MESIIRRTSDVVTRLNLKQSKYVLTETELQLMFNFRVRLSIVSIKLLFTRLAEALADRSSRQGHGWMINLIFPNSVACIICSQNFAA